MKVILLLVMLLLEGCRGYVSESPPFHVNPNMDTQEKGKAYKESSFFSDKKYMRDPIEGTIPYGKLKESDPHFYFGKVNGKLSKSFPKNLRVDYAFLKKGEKLFNRTCSICHSVVGDGKGLVGKRLIVQPTSFHSDYMYDQPPGHYFDVITNGIRNMGSYAYMLKEEDRWAVIAHIRVLQMSQDINGQWIKRSQSWWKQ